MSSSRILGLSGCASDRIDVLVDGREAPVTIPGAGVLFLASAAAFDETVLRAKPARIAATDSDAPVLVRGAAGLGLAAPTPTVDRRLATVLPVAPVFLSPAAPAEFETTVLSLRDVDLGFWSSSLAPTLGALRWPIVDVEAVDRCAEVDVRVGCLFRVAADRAEAVVRATVEVAVALA